MGSRSDRPWRLWLRSHWDRSGGCKPRVGQKGRRSTFTFGNGSLNLDYRILLVDSSVLETRRVENNRITSRSTSRLKMLRGRRFRKRCRRRWCDWGRRKEIITRETKKLEGKGPISFERSKVVRNIGCRNIFHIVVTLVTGHVREIERRS